MSSNTNALVTGAAARIGAAIARTLHNRGCNLVLHYNANADGATALAEELNGLRPRSAALATADLSRIDGVKSLAAQVDSAVHGWGGSLNILVNNASRFYPTSVSGTQPFEWDDLLNSNLRGPYFLIQELLPALQSAGGCIVNILDIHAHKPMPGHTAYCISKAGLKMLTLSLAAELAPAVRVNGVAPGAILWPEREMEKGARKAILARTALGRLGAPDDVASAVAYLALDAHYVTGEILNVDGGRSLNI
jgi:pteridine reductase